MTRDLALAATLIVSTLVAAAALLKVVRQADFRRELGDYDIVPRWLVRPLALLVPGVELCVAVAVVVPDTRRAGSAALTVLLAVFTAVLAQALLRGRSDIGCACLGRSSRSITWRLPVRNVVLLAAPVALLAAGAEAAEVSFGAYVAAALGAMTCWVVLELAALAETRAA